ncbi:MAG: class I SAM-dependent methyltransferase [Planctomycetes bacterium]|nr:class I SAM-dependent methyltransferase [Planctomycetota bacterium]
MLGGMSEPARDTTSPAYTRYLAERAGWKRFIDVQAPYRWNLRRLELGFTLDLGCGTGRNLAHLGGHGVGIDHNAHSVAAARARGLDAYTGEEFARSPHATPGRFDTLLVAHVLEHLQPAQALALVGEHLPFVKSGGRVVLLTPQERGFASDATHVAFTGFDELERVLTANGLVLVRRYSFPFPRFVGRLFAHNEFVVVARKA